MQEINLGELTSFIYCEKCRMPISIHAGQEKITCENCNTDINLKVLFGMDLIKDFNIQSL